MKKRVFVISADEIKFPVAEPYLTRGKEYYTEGVVELKNVRINKVKARVLG